MKQFLQQTLNITTAAVQNKQRGQYQSAQQAAANNPQKLNQSQTQKLNLRERKSIGGKKQYQNLSSHNVTLEPGAALGGGPVPLGARAGMVNLAQQQRPTTAVTQNKQGEEKSIQQRIVKSSRTLVQAKQQNLTRHKRNKSEVKKQNPGASSGAAASRQGISSVQKGQKKAMQSKKITIKTERNLNIDRRKSAEQATQPTSWMTSVTNAHAVMNNNFMKADAEGMSMSSISSGEKMDSSMMAAGKNRHNLSIQQHLSKNYFLNSKQLLRHLSPARLNQQISFGPNQPPQLEVQSSMDAQRAPPNSQCTFQKGTLSMGLTTRQTRQRNRSTSNAPAKRGWPNQTANHSNSRKAQSLSNSRESGQNVFQGPAVPVIRDKKHQLESKDQKIDRIIRQNIKKNRNKQNEESLKRHEADLQQKKRKEELSQLNQQVRMINASKIVNQQERRMQEGDYSSALQPPGTLSGGNNSTKRRSQSAIEGINLSGGRKRNTSSGDKRIHHSQSNRAGTKSKPSEQQKTSPQQQSKYLPHTTKAEFPGKPRSFVEEINQLTHQIEREIGKGSLKLDLSNQRPTNFVKKSPNPMCNDDSVNIQIKSSAATTQVIAQQKSQENPMEKKIKRQQKRHSLQVLKFMEKKKRLHQMKKSMELTIEVGKQLQIQQNLFKLDNYVKKHNRQRSSQGGEKKSHGGSKKVRRAKNVVQQNGIVDITNIKPTSRNLAQHDGLVLYEDTEDRVREAESVNVSKDFQTAMNVYQLNPGHKQTVFMKHKSKSIGSVPSSVPQRSRYETQRPQRSPEKVTKQNISSPPPPPLSQPLTDAAGDHVLKKKAYRDMKKQQRQSQQPPKVMPDTEKPKEKKLMMPPPQMVLPQQQLQQPIQMQQQPQQPVLQPSAKLTTHQSIQSYSNVEIDKAGHGRSAVQKGTQSSERQPTAKLEQKATVKQPTPIITNNLPPQVVEEQISPKSVEQIRRIHELVALYRCRFKANASDAAVMGTLHSAASVIQIHFRYLKHLKEAGLQSRKAQGKKKDPPSQPEPIAKTVPKTQPQPPQQQQNQQQQPYLPQQLQQQQQQKLQQQQLQQQKQQQSQQQSIQQPKQQPKPQLPEQVSNTISDRRMSSRSGMPSERLSGGRSEIHDGSSIKNSKGRLANVHDEPNINNVSQQTSRGNKTPLIVPGLDFGKLNAAEKDRNGPIPNVVPKPGPESPKAPLTASSYSSIFNKLGLPIPRSARIKVDFDLVKKYPTISAQLKEIIEFKELKGKQVMEDGRKLQLITDRTYQKNQLRLERWVTTSKNKVDEFSQERERHANSAKKRQNHKTEDELINDTYDNRQRLVQKLNSIDAQSGKPSARIQSGRSKASQRNGNAGNGNNTNGNGNGPSQREEDPNPYMNKQLTISGYLHSVNDKQIGSSRQEKSKIVELINSSRTSNKKKERSSDSQDNNTGIQRVQDIRVDLVESGKNLDSQRIKNLMQFGDTKEPSENQFAIESQEQADQNIPNNGGSGEEMVIINQGMKVSSESQGNADGSVEAENSNQLNRTQSLNQMFSQQPDKDVDLKMKDNLNEDSEKDQNKPESSRSESKAGIKDIVEHLSDLLEHEQQKELQEGLNYRESDPSSAYPTNNKLVVSQVTSCNNSEYNKDPNTQMAQPSIAATAPEDPPDNEYSMNQQPQSTEPPTSQDSVAIVTKPSQHIHMQIRSSSQSMTNSQLNSFQPSNQTSPKIHRDVLNTNSPASEFDYPQHKPPHSQPVPGQPIQDGDSPRELINIQNQMQPNNVSGRLETKIQDIIASVEPNPASPGSEPQALQIHAGAISISSTDSDRPRPSNNPNNTTPNLESPPNILGGSSEQPLLNVIDMQEQKLEEEKAQTADDIAGAVLGSLLQELTQEIPNLVARPNVNRNAGGGVLQQQIKFFEKKGIKTDLFAIEKYVEEVLLEVMENKEEFMAEIKRPLGKTPLDQLYQMQNDEIGNYEHFHQEQKPVLALDLYLRIEKRRKDSKEQADDSRPDGLFDFDEVTAEELAEDRVDRNFLSECAHIHNKVLFDCINDSLQQFRPHGKDGPPMEWSRLGRKLKPIEDFTLEEMFEITKHDLFRMAIMQAGTLPRKEFVFGGQFDEELFSEIREKKLATLLVREIVETEPQWLKWDFEETQTKVDLADMVLESLMTETIDFLNSQQQKMQGDGLNSRK